MSDLLSTITQIVKYGRNTNSYKFALLRALIRQAPHTDPNNPQIATRALAEEFVALYWPIEVTFRLRQGSDPDKDPIVMKEIRKLISSKKIPSGISHSDFKRRHHKAWDHLCSVVEQKAFRDVIPRFHMLRKQAANKALYRYPLNSVKKGGSIELTPEGRYLLINQASTLDLVAVQGWARFTESFSSSPKLTSKLSGEPPTRKPLSKWLPALSKMQSNKCFYCEGQIRSKPHIDHFLPWSFVFEDKAWNLVMCCKICNLQKSDQLPSELYLRKILLRNRNLLSTRVHKETNAFFRDFSEWHTRDMNGHINLLYDQAKNNDFPLWKGIK